MPRSSGQNAHAEPRDLLGGKPDQVATFERHRAGALADQAHHRLERRGLAGAIAAEQRHHLARANLEVHAVKDVGLAVPRLEILDGEHRRAGGVIHGGVTHGPLPDRLP